MQYTITNNIMQTFNQMTQYLVQSLILKIVLFGKRWIKMFFLSYKNLIKHCLCPIRQQIHTRLNKIFKIHCKNWSISIATNINLVLHMTKSFQVYYRLRLPIMKLKELQVKLFVRKNFSLLSKTIFLQNILSKLFRFN